MGEAEEEGMLEGEAGRFAAAGEAEFSVELSGEREGDGMVGEAREEGFSAEEEAEGGVAGEDGVKVGVAARGVRLDGVKAGALELLLQLLPELAGTSAPKTPLFPASTRLHDISLSLSPPKFSLYIYN